MLITRPQAEAEVLADEMRVRGFVPVLQPLLEIVPLPFTVPDEYQALAFTSANAVRAAAAYLPGKNVPVYCVGTRTAEAARRAGWQDIRAADGDVHALRTLLATAGLLSDKPVLHLSGVDIAAPLDAPGLEICRIPVYKAAAGDHFSPQVLDLIGRSGLTAALFFSPRTARIFADLAAKYGLMENLRTTKALCLADSVVKSLLHLPWQDVQVAPAPDRTALLALLDKIKT